MKNLATIDKQHYMALCRNQFNSSKDAAEGNRYAVIQLIVISDVEATSCVSWPLFTIEATEISVSVRDPNLSFLLTLAISACPTPATFQP